MKIGQYAAQKIIIVVVTHQAEKIWTYDCTTVRLTIQGATFNIHGQLYHGHANATALSSSLVVSALGSELDNPGSSPGCGKALCPWDVREKKMQALLLGLAKSIYYYHNPIFLSSCATGFNVSHDQISPGRNWRISEDIPLVPNWKTLHLKSNSR